MRFIHSWVMAGEMAGWGWKCSSAKGVGGDARTFRVDLQGREAEQREGGQDGQAGPRRRLRRTCGREQSESAFWVTSSRNSAIGLGPPWWARPGLN